MRSDIHVYLPTFPRQLLPETPHTILKSEQLVPSPGYIDEQHPHAINSLTVGELGLEEVLVSAHDDGNVCVWYTRDLARIALRLSVGKSAWGVALHKARRLLAVSANSHVITVFELGVGKNKPAAREARNRRGRGGSDEEGEAAAEEKATAMAMRAKGKLPIYNAPVWTKKRPAWGESDGDGDDDGGGGEQGREHGCEGCRRRARPRKIKKRRKERGQNDRSVKTLTGHANNIPNISFLDDDSGRWLTGTDIDGVVILWDVHTQRMVEKCKLGFLQYEDPETESSECLC